MSLIVVVPPYADPVDLDEAKLQARVDLVDDDSLIQSWISAATKIAEKGTEASFQRMIPAIVRTFELRLNCFPWGSSRELQGFCPYGSIDLPAEGILGAAVVTYVDTAGVTRTVDSANYAVDPAGAINPAFGFVWPIARAIANAVTVRFTAGLAAPFTVSASVVTLKGRTIADGDLLRLMNSGGTLPSGLASGTDYFAVSSSGGSCRLALTAGGSPVTIVGSGNGIHFAGLDLGRFETLRNAIKLLIGHFNENREAVTMSQFARDLPMGVRALIDAAHV